MLEKKQRLYLIQISKEWRIIAILWISWFEQGFCNQTFLLRLTTQFIQILQCQQFTRIKPRWMFVSKIDRYLFQASNCIIKCWELIVRTRCVSHLIDPNDSSHQLLFQSIEILWNLLENGSREQIVEQLNNTVCIRSVTIRNAMYLVYGKAISKESCSEFYFCGIHQVIILNGKLLTAQYRNRQSIIPSPYW